MTLPARWSLVVKDGQVLFAKGYGYSDVKDKKPVTR